MPLSLITELLRQMMTAKRTGIKLQRQGMPRTPSAFRYAYLIDLHLCLELRLRGTSALHRLSLPVACLVSDATLCLASNGQVAVAYSASTHTHLFQLPSPTDLTYVMPDPCLGPKRRRKNTKFSLKRTTCLQSSEEPSTRGACGVIGPPVTHTWCCVYVTELAMS
jgi:hypothetical protein